MESIKLMAVTKISLLMFFLIFIVLLCFSNISFANSLDNSLYSCRINQISYFNDGRKKFMDTNGRLIRINTKEKSLSDYTAVP